jgi:hypothetical protein
MELWEELSSLEESALSHFWKSGAGTGSALPEMMMNCIWEGLTGMRDID